jgi:hypothetical protein
MMHSIVRLLLLSMQFNMIMLWHLLLPNYIIDLFEAAKKQYVIVSNIGL